MSAYYHQLARSINQHGVVTTKYQASPLTQGAWNPNEQHMAAVTGLICAELEQFVPREHMRIGRISLDIYGLITLGEIELTTQTIRAGKTIELIETTLKGQNQILVVARAWRMMTQDSSSIAGLEDQANQMPENLAYFSDFHTWSGQFIQTIDVRTEQQRQGKGLVWLRTQTDMIEGQETSAFVRLLGMVDMANGVVSRQAHPVKWAFPNLDLQIHLHRLPQGTWLGLETVQQYGLDGIGLTSAILHDVYGPFGRSEQILTLRPLEG